MTRRRHVRKKLSPLTVALKVTTDVFVVLAGLALLIPAVLLTVGVLPYQVYVVHTGSMSPTIPSKSAVVVKKGAYHVGQVITFDGVNGLETHRLIARKSDGTLVTKGDANRTPDPGTLRPSQVVGGVVAAPRMLGYWLVYLRNPAGMASVFLTVLCLWLIESITADLAKREQLNAMCAQLPASRAPRGSLGRSPGI